LTDYSNVFSETRNGAQKSSGIDKCLSFILFNRLENKRQFKKKNLKDEIIKLKGGFTLDINLEKSRSTQNVIEIE
jgi:hypothetical protein